MRRTDTPTSRDLQAAERRAQLLDAAKRLFAEHGYNGTTTRQITAAIGMADGLIYHYFPGGKKQILDTIIQGFDERWQQVEAEMRTVTADLPLDAALWQLGTIVFRYMGTDKHLLIILLRENSILSDRYSETFNRHVQSVMQKTVSVLQSKIEQQEIRSLDVFMMANQFCSSIYAYILQNALFGEKNFYSLDREAYLRSVIDYSLQTWKV